MGKHDKTIAASSEEFYRNRIEDLEKRLASAKVTIDNQKEMIAKLGRWVNEIEASAQDKVSELEAEVEKWKGKALSLVDHHVI